MQLKRKMLIGVALLTVCLGSLRAVHGDDWPMWCGSPSRNMVSSARNLPASFNPGTRLPGGAIDTSTCRNIKWIAPLGTMTFGNPVVADGRVFVGTNDDAWSDPRAKRSNGGVVLCLDARNGKRLWALLVPRYADKVYGSNFDDMDLGVCSSPTVEGDRLYLVSNRGEVLCMDVKGQSDGNDGPYKNEGQYMAGPDGDPIELRKDDGDIVWRFDMIKALPAAPHDATNCNVLVHGDYLYVGTGNGVHRMPTEPNPLPDAPSIIVLHKKTGRLVAVDREGIGKHVFHGQWSSPTLIHVKGKPIIVYGAGDGRLYGFHAWRGIPDRRAPSSLRRAFVYDCLPRDFRYDEDGKALDYWMGDFSRVKDRKGEYIGPSEIIATPVFHDGRLYVAVGRDPVHGLAPGMLHCIDPSLEGDITRKGRIWTYDKIDRSMSTVSIADGLLYVADLRGDVHCVDIKTGQRVWRLETKQPIWSSTLVADGKVYVATEKHRLWVLRAGRKLEVLSEIKLTSRCSTTPIVADGVMYLASHRYLYTIAAPQDNDSGEE